jgi:hypothetical protein
LTPRRPSYRDCWRTWITPAIGSNTGGAEWTSRYSRPQTRWATKERAPALIALTVLTAEFRESGHDAVVALFDAIASAITGDARDQDSVH